MISPSASNFARAVFVTLSCLLGIAIAFGFFTQKDRAWIGALGGTVFGLAVILIDQVLRNFTFRGFSNATVGLLVGVLCAWLVSKVDLFGGPWMDVIFEDPGFFQSLMNLGVYLIFGFLGVSLALRAHREEFSLIIPYVRFRQDSARDSPLLVDTNVIIDGRIPLVCETGFLSGSLVVPRFVLEELQILADSPDPIKRERGKRGLEYIGEMRSADNLDVTIHDDNQSRDELVDAKLVQLARRIGARLLTKDSNLENVARLQGVEVLNLNALAHAMRTKLMPGDPVVLKLVKGGKDNHQAVGYMPDGTMIVVNHARRFLGEKVTVVVGGTLQTAAGRLLFAELNEPDRATTLPASASSSPASPSGHEPSPSRTA